MRKMGLFLVALIFGLSALFLFGCDGDGGGDDDDDTDDDTDDDDDSEPGGPDADIISPTDGAVITVGAEVTFTGEATDEEDGTIPCESLAWESSVDGAIGTGCSFVKSDLSAGEHAIKLTATDSDGKKGWATVNILLNQAPSCSIVSPLADERFLVDEEIVFEANASDPEDGAIEENNIIWISDIDGELGRGSTLSKSDLSEGDHIITLQVIDSDGGMCFSGVAISVVEGKEWTILIYLDGDNNLDSAGVDDMEEMEEIGSNDYIDIVVLFDRASSGAKLWHVMPGSSVEIQNLGEVNMGDPQTLINFVSTAVELFPAKRYLLDLWDHGSGWSDKDDPRPNKGVCWDDSNGGDYLDNDELDSAMTQIFSIIGKKVDIIGFDACLMQCIEIGHYLADSADYMVGSEQTEPWDGWEYNDFLDDLAADPQMTPEELGTAIVDAYYNESSANSTLSIIDLTMMNEVVTQVNSFASTLTNCSCNSQLNTLADNTRKFSGIYKDFYNFCDKVATSSLPTDVKNAATAMKGVLDNFIVYSASYYANAYGVTIYYPTPSGYDDSYDDLPWADATTWDDFVKQARP